MAAKMSGCPKEFEQQLINWRRHLHQHPELSDREYHTTASITRWLQEKNIRMLPLELKTGVVAEFGEGDGPTVALRADIDALPIEEAVDVPYRSCQPGVMHACGHDTHTAVMLGAACLLKTREQRLKGKVRVLFQPAEEISTGARQLIDAGALSQVSAIFGLHNAPELPTGTFATRTGPFYANIDRFTIRVVGKGAHAAKPEQGVDSILTACNIVSALQTLPSRNFSALESVVVSVSRISGGHTWNVLPQDVELEGTVRTYNAAIRAEIPHRITQLITGIAQSMGATAELDWQPGPPAVNNHHKWAEFSKTVAQQAGYCVEEAELQMSGEDFALYLQQVPGTFVSIGSNSDYGLHHPQFNPDERLLAPAAYYFADLAEQALDHLVEI